MLRRTIRPAQIHMLASMKYRDIDTIGSFADVNDALLNLEQALVNPAELQENKYAFRNLRMTYEELYSGFRTRFFLAARKAEVKED